MDILSGLCVKPPHRQPQILVPCSGGHSEHATRHVVYDLKSLMQMRNHPHYYLLSPHPPGSLSTMSTPSTSNGVFVVIPPSNASSLRPPPAILPTSMCQPSGIMQFEEPPLGTQTPRATQPPDLRPMETFLTGEPKALGVRTASQDSPGLGWEEAPQLCSTYGHFGAGAGT